MKTKHKKNGGGRVRITQTFSLLPRHVALIATELQASSERDQRPINRSQLVQDLIDEGLGGTPSTRFIASQTSHLDVDVKGVLEAAGYSVAQRVDAGPGLVDLVATMGKRVFNILTCPCSRITQLEPALGRALVLKHAVTGPVAVVAPYIIDAGVAEAYKHGGIMLCTPETIVSVLGGN